MPVRPSKRYSPAGCTRTRLRRAAFSLIEALVAIAILGLAASAILLASHASMQATEDALERTVAAGIAKQLVDEILGLPYKDPSDPIEDWPLGLENGEPSAQRILFNDTDDFDGYSAMPPRDAWEIPLGLGNAAGGSRWSSMRLPAGYFSGWSADVDVQYVDPNDLSQELPSQTTSEFRAVTVTIRRGSGNSARVLAQIRRVYSYVPPPA